MKTDADLKRDVTSELAWDPAIKASRVGVAVQDGVVTLSGHVANYVEKYAIERAVKRVSGVRAVALDLEVELAPEHRRDDTDIAAAAERALRWNTLVPIDAIRVMVDNGWVTLSGEVDWDYQRQAAYKAIRTLVGVVGVSNDIALRPRTTTPEDIGNRITDALRRHAEREAQNVEVLVSGSTVTLRGSVDSWSERAATGNAAWSAPGVASVVNELRVTG